MIRFIFSLIILILPFGELLRLPIFANTYLRVLDVLTFLLALFLIIKDPKKLFAAKPLLVFLGILLISNLANPLNPQAAAYLLRTLVYYSLIPYFLNPDYRLLPPKKIWLHFNLLIFVLLGLVQYFYYPELRNLYYLGYDPHSYRLVGLFLDPNLSSLLLAWIIIYFGKIKNSLAKPLIALSFLSLLLTYSRIGWLSLLLAWFYQNRKKLTIKTTGIVIACFALGIWLLPRHFGEGTNLLRVNSIFSKVESSQLVVDSIKKRPLLGIGYNNIHLLKDKQQEPIANNSLYGIDNSWLTVLITTGFLGFTSFVLLWKQIWALSSKSQQGLLMVYLLHSLSVNSLFVPTIFLFFWLFYLNLHKSPSKFAP